MKRKTVEVKLEGKRFPVKGWGISSVPGVTLTSLYQIGTGGEVGVADPKTTVLVHDQSGLFIAFYRGGVKGLEGFVTKWAGGGVDWFRDSDELRETGRDSLALLLDVIHKGESV